jgi:hypothetical protein
LDGCCGSFVVGSCALLGDGEEIVGSDGGCGAGAPLVLALAGCPADAGVGVVPDAGVGAVPAAAGVVAAPLAGVGWPELGVGDPLAVEAPLGVPDGGSGAVTGLDTPVSGEPEHPASACIAARAEMTYRHVDRMAGSFAAGGHFTRRAERVRRESRARLLFARNDALLGERPLLLAHQTDASALRARHRLSRAS